MIALKQPCTHQPHSKTTKAVSITSQWSMQDILRAQLGRCDKSKPTQKQKQFYNDQIHSNNMFARSY